MEFLENNRIKVDPPKKPKKLTATRFAAIMGLNKWSSPFAAWCEMTRTYEEPFAESIYTVAGKVIEPKICEYLRNRYFMDIKSPTDVYGKDYFKKTWGDFFPDVVALGGMWDFLGDDFVVEVKTTKRVEDWKGPDGKVEAPIYYKLQAALYAYLLGFDDVVMTCSFLTDADYPIEENDGKFCITPTEAFVPSMENTVVYEFKVSEEFPTFKESYIEPALQFWNDHVLTGISPAFDEKQDAEILKVLRKNVVEVTTDELDALIAEADKLQIAVDKGKEKIAEKEKRLKEINDQVKKILSQSFRPGDKKVEFTGKRFVWTLTKSQKKTVDGAKAIARLVQLKAPTDDLYKISETVSLTKAPIEKG